MEQDEARDTIATKLALMAQDIKYTNRQVDDIKARVNSGFVTKDEFAPVKERVDSIIRALMWVVSLLVGGLALAFIKLVVK
jgi:hypothetical protein